MALLVDSSVWIDYFNDIRNAQTDYLDQALGSLEMVTGDLIVAEVLQGFRTDTEFHLAKNALLQFPVLTMVGPDVAFESASFPPVAQERNHDPKNNRLSNCNLFGLTLLHRDSHFDPFERYLGLKVAKVL